VRKRRKNNQEAVKNTPIRAKAMPIAATHAASVARSDSFSVTGVSCLD